MIDFKSVKKASFEHSGKGVMLFNVGFKNTQYIKGRKSN